jgi:tRNA A-37 threonylcarbamoyl transferase component Bud32
LIEYPGTEIELAMQRQNLNQAFGFALAIIVISCGVPAVAQTALETAVQSTAGGITQSDSATLLSVIGQPAPTGITSEGQFTLLSGYVYTVDSIASVVAPEMLGATSVETRARLIRWPYLGGAAVLLLLALIATFIYQKRRGAARDTKQSRHRAIAAALSFPKNARYRQEEIIGRGGMGVMYKAYDLKLKRPVAIKVILLQDIFEEAEIEERIVRFRREMQITAVLNHPNIVNIYDYEGFEASQTENNLYMVMEYVEGQSLKEILAQEQRLACERASDVVKQTCQALEYAHAHNIAHRDIKPSNLMLTGDGWVKVLDFGLAKALDPTELEDLTLSGQRTPGTALYMSPEQRNWTNTDHRSDIYSLGLVFYEMLSGKLPEGLWKNKPLARLSASFPDVPPRIDVILAQMLAIDPDKRYQSAHEVFEELSLV